MKNSAITIEENKEPTFRVYNNDQAGGIFTHDDAIKTTKKYTPLAQIISPATGDDSEANNGDQQ